MEIEIITQLFLAVILGSLIGLERELKRKEAGLQTYSLVTLGACLFTIIYFELTKFEINFNPSGLIQAIAIGIGFLGAGVIFRQTTGTVGLTTAAGLWTTAAIGMAVGAKFYFLAIFAAFLTILIFAGLGLLEEKFFKKKEENVSGE